MSRNLKLFPLYLVLIRLDFWLPVFFLYFSTLFTLERVLLLEAVYYISVVLLEVPSGYFSDSVGRRWTLAAAAAAGAVSGYIFFSAQTFAAFCAAQFFYAMFMAFNSGSDGSLLYDTLKTLGREKEMLDFESKAHASSLFFGALGAVVAGGAAALFGYRSVYALSVAAYIAAAITALAFSEPPRAGEAPEKNMLRQIGACRGLLKDSTLLWVFVFYVGRTIFEHIPYEFFQPYTGFVVGAAWLPAVTGTHLAVTKLVSAYFARRAARWGGGVFGTLLFTHWVVFGLIVLMALWAHPVVVFLLLLRNIPHGLGQPVMNAAIHPRVPSRLRATYFSLQSLAGRLSFAGALLGLSWWAGPGGQGTHADLSRLLALAAGACAIYGAGLFLFRPRALPAVGNA